MSSVSVALFLKFYIDSRRKADNFSANLQIFIYLNRQIAPKREKKQEEIDEMNVINNNNKFKV